MLSDQSISSELLVSPEYRVVCALKFPDLGAVSAVTSVSLLQATRIGLRRRRGLDVLTFDQTSDRFKSAELRATAEINRVTDVCSLQTHGLALVRQSVADPVAVVVALLDAVVRHRGSGDRLSAMRRAVSELGDCVHERVAGFQPGARIFISTMWVYQRLAQDWSSASRILAFLDVVKRELMVPLPSELLPPVDVHECFDVLVPKLLADGASSPPFWCGIELALAHKYSAHFLTPQSVQGAQQFERIVRAMSAALTPMARARMDGAAIAKAVEVLEHVLNYSSCRSPTAISYVWRSLSVDLSWPVHLRLWLCGAGDETFLQDLDAQLFHDFSDTATNNSNGEMSNEYLLACEQCLVLGSALAQPAWKVESSSVRSQSASLDSTLGARRLERAQTMVQRRIGQTANAFWNGSVGWSVALARQAPLLCESELRRIQHHVRVGLDCVRPNVRLEFADFVWQRLLLESVGVALHDLERAALDAETQSQEAMRRRLTRLMPHVCTLVRENRRAVQAAVRDAPDDGGAQAAVNACADFAWHLLGLLCVFFPVDETACPKGNGVDLPDIRDDIVDCLDNSMQVCANHIGLLTCMGLGDENTSDRVKSAYSWVSKCSESHVKLRTNSEQVFSKVFGAGVAGTCSAPTQVS